MEKTLHLLVLEAHSADAEPSSIFNAVKHLPNPSHIACLAIYHNLSAVMSKPGETSEVIYEWHKEVLLPTECSI